MSEPNTIKINEVEYVRKDSIAPPSGNIRIAVLQRGWIVVGYYKKEGDMCILSHCAIFRNWGTTKGLGQIAKEGPTKDTILDKCEDIEWHILTGIFTMRCVEEVWKSFLS